jgi:hypothetical protein
MESINLTNFNLNECSDESSYSCNVEDHNKGWCDDFEVEIIKEATETDPPEWNDILYPETVATFNQATHDASEIARREISTVQQNITRKLRLDQFSNFKLNFC